MRKGIERVIEPSAIQPLEKLLELPHIQDALLAAYRYIQEVRRQKHEAAGSTEDNEPVDNRD